MAKSLEDISGIGKATADRIRAVGIDSIEKLANTKVEDLVKLEIKGIGQATAEKYIENAKKLLDEVGIKEKEKKELKQKEEIRKKVKPKIEVSNIKELIKKQVECNIGLVGHVDHGMR